MAINSQQERIIGFLAQGLQPSQVASIIGCSPAYISQLCGKDGPEGFKEALKERVKEIASAKGNREEAEEGIVSSKYLSMEHKLIRTIEDRMGEADFGQLVGALKVVGDRQEKRALRKAGAGLQQIGSVVQQIVNISVPSHSLPELRMNERLQVTAIDNRIMAPMSSEAVRQLFKSRRPAAEYVNAIEARDAISAEDAIAADF